MALFTETYLPHINGVVTHVKILKEGLEQLGHQVLIVTADSHTHRHYLEDGVLHCPALTSKKFYGYSIAKPISRARLKFVERFSPDIIHIHNEFGIGFSGMLCAKLLKVPLVYTLHTMYDDYIYYVAPKLLLNTTTQISHKYMKFFAVHANAVTGPSKKCEEYFRLTGVDKDVNVIPNAVEMDQFAPKNFDDETKAALRLRHGIKPDAMLACFVGRLGREKSVDVLLDYWAQSITPADNITLLVIGEGPVRAELMEQAEKLGISDMVIFTGKVPHDELPPYYAISDVYVTASLSDTNSISMLEGMCSGLPVLQRTDPLNADQVREGDNGFVFDDAAQFGDKLRRIREMAPEDMVQFRHAVTESIRNSGARTLAQNTLNVYEKVLGKVETSKKSRR
ncbi:MAG: glycosyltransferase [Angelakisella sp.]